MKSSNIITTFLCCASILILPNFANAEVMNDIKANYKKIKIVTSSQKDNAGVEHICKDMHIFRNTENTGLRAYINLTEYDKKKLVRFSVIFVGHQWLNLDSIIVGDGVDEIILRTRNGT